MIKKLALTEEHLKLLPFLFINESETNENIVEIDKSHLYLLGGHVLEDLADILGYRDTYIKGTEESPDGKAYPDDVENHLLEVHNYMKDNLLDIEVLIHQFAARGGLQPGTYKCKDNENIWSREDGKQ